MTCSPGYQLFQDQDDLFYFYCFDGVSFDWGPPSFIELEADPSYSGLLCPGSTSYETITEGTMVYCSEPWLAQPGAIGVSGGWPEIAPEDLGPLLSAGVALLAVAFVGRVLIRLARA
jgi:hypothetical protein